MDRNELLQQFVAAIGASGFETNRKFLDVKIERKEGIITLPPGMSHTEARDWFDVKIKEDEQVVAVQEEIMGFPLDVVHSLFVAISQKYGYHQAKPTPGFFGPKPPKFMAVPINHKGDTKDVLVGKFRLPGIDGDFSTVPKDSSGLYLMGEVKKKHLEEVKQLAALTRETLKTHSLYKGKAIKLDLNVTSNDMVMPTFMDLNAGYEHLFLNHTTQMRVDAAVWNLIRYRERFKRMGKSTQRGALLHGDYGSGKTLCVNHTARLATEHGWTTLYVPNVDQILRVFPIALQWQPVIIIVEDQDQLNADYVQPLSTLLDGVDTKNSDLIYLATTNHPKDVEPILLRPGRIGQSIRFDRPDAKTLERLIEFYAVDASTGESVLAPDIDWHRATKAMAGNTPSVIREIVEYSMSSAIHREPLMLTTDDLEITALGMREHAQLNVPPEKEPSSAEKLQAALVNVIQTAVSGSANNHSLDEIYSLTDDVDDRVRIIQQNTSDLEAHSDDIEQIKDTVLAILKSQ